MSWLSDRLGGGSGREGEGSYWDRVGAKWEMLSGKLSQPSDDFGKVDLPPAPGPGASESELERYQLELLRRQVSRQEEQEEFQMGTIGYRRVPVNPARIADLEQRVQTAAESQAAQTGREKHEAGQALTRFKTQLSAERSRTKYEQIPYSELTPEQQLSVDIVRLRGERTRLALSPEGIPISEPMERRLQAGLRTTELGVARRKGLRSSPGIQEMGLAQQSAEALREQVRRGEITEGFAAYLQQQQQTTGLERGLLQDVTAGRLGTIGAFNAPLSRLTGLRFGQQSLAAQIAMQEAQGRIALRGQEYDLYGNIIGTAGTIYRAG